MTDALSVALDEPHETGIRERHRHLAVAADQTAHGRRVRFVLNRTSNLRYTSFDQAYRQARVGTERPPPP